MSYPAGTWAVTIVTTLVPATPDLNVRLNKDILFKGSCSVDASSLRAAHPEDVSD